MDYISPISPWWDPTWGDFISRAGRGLRRLTIYRRNHAKYFNQPTCNFIHRSFPRFPACVRNGRKRHQEGVSLLEIDGNMGLILADLINGFGLNAEDQYRILGSGLFGEVQDFLYSPKQS